MPSLKDLRVRIKSVKSTQKITKAMKMVAASKLRRAREAAEASRPYAERIERMVQNLGGGLAQNESAPLLLRGTGQSKKHLLVMMTADRGLCGAFNSSIVRATKRKIIELRAQGKEVGVIAVGKKGAEQLGAEYRSLVVARYQDILRKRVQYAQAEEIAQEVLNVFERDGYDVATVVYNQFKSAISQVVTFQQVIPLAITANENAAEQIPYEYEPGEEAILADLLPRNLAMQVFSALLESAASEQGARMTAMDNATRNAGEIIKKITLKYNRTRQAQITKELIEIISGAEAL